MSKVTFLCDEAASLGANMSCIDDAIDKGRGYGIGLIMIYQALAQLAPCFPKDGGQTLLANVTQVYFGTNDNQTAEEVSKRLGEHTIIVESGGTSRGTSKQSGDMGKPSHYGRSTSTNANWNQQARRLLKPEEVMNLNERIAITFAQGGTRPILSRLERYYEKGRMGSPRFQGFKTVLGTILMLAMGTLCAMAATHFVRSGYEGHRYFSGLEESRRIPQFLQ
jgi:type IV secretion system protein VirD4